MGRHLLGIPEIHSTEGNKAVRMDGVKDVLDGRRDDVANILDIDVLFLCFYDEGFFGFQETL